MTTQNVVGIDPSMTATAICVYSPGQWTEPWTVVYGSKPPSNKSVAAKIARYDRIVARVMETVSQADPAMILVEGYSFGSPAKAHLIGELGGLLRKGLLTIATVIEIPPNTLKLFAGGKGNADKVAVAVGLAKRYGVEFKTHHEYDAYGLARLGACLLGWEEPATDAQRRAVEKVQPDKSE